MLISIQIMNNDSTISEIDIKSTRRNLDLNLAEDLILLRTLIDSKLDDKIRNTIDYRNKLKRHCYGKELGR